MDIKVIIEKPIDKKAIDTFCDDVVYQTAMMTREYTKGEQAYPYKTGRLSRTEQAEPVHRLGMKSYGLGAGVDYAQAVWNMTNVNWTNPNTKEQWYMTEWKNHKEKILSQAVSNAKNKMNP